MQAHSSSKVSWLLDVPAGSQQAISPKMWWGAAQVEPGGEPPRYMATCCLHRHSPSQGGSPPSGSWARGGGRETPGHHT
jgi:hypothetical protein